MMDLNSCLKLSYFCLIHRQNTIHRQQDTIHVANTYQYTDPYLHKYHGR